MEDLKAGVELDRIIAEKVMGWKWIVPTELGHPHPALFNEDGLFELLPCYSSNIAAAWDVVDKLKLMPYSKTDSDGGNEIRIEWHKSKKWSCRLWNESLDECYGETAPHAICLAALKAVGE